MECSEAIEFEVAPPSLGFAMSVRLGDTAGRWHAVARCRDAELVGIGATAREALKAAFMPLGPLITSMLMADTALFGASARLLAR